MTLLVLPAHWRRNRRNRWLMALAVRAGWEVQVLDANEPYGGEMIHRVVIDMKSSFFSSNRL